MSELEVLVRTCPGKCANLIVDENRITISIPTSHHNNLTEIHKGFGSWKVDFSRTNPGFGKPYLLKLVNKEKVNQTLSKNNIYTKNNNNYN